MTGTKQPAGVGSHPENAVFTMTALAAMVLSLWLLPLGGTASKAVLVGFWGLAVLRAGMGRVSRHDVAGGLCVLALCVWIGIGAGTMDEKIRLIGNVVLLPLGIVAGAVYGRRCILPVGLAMGVFLVFDARLILTHEGWRLNHPFLFLALVSIWAGTGDKAGKTGAILAALAVMMSQTRIAVLALLVIGVGHLRWQRAVTWLWLLPAALALVGIAALFLPRLLQTHGSGRLAFWQMFWQAWQNAPAPDRWFGFGAGRVEAVLSQLDSAASFGALHNDHFRILFETGWIGAGLWGMLWIWLVWRVRSSRAAVMILLSVMLTMITDNTLSYGHYLIVSGIAAGMAMRNADDR
ncbi:O-antigen ligase [Thalassospira sp.]|uniref:O-antigen ligase family protein n=1 Tax=Thalassospira sp. TaxID=1912094 RepID=UPI0027349420|nr:O-antigen ligase family protein [Thalassospira sp.]MDP2698720.1 O-antigen ligase family protein [Thalassospira sp.]